MQVSLYPPERISMLKFFERLPNTQFVIPVYQRKYIWTAKKQVKKYLEDLNSIINSNKTGHFIGIIMYLTIPRGIGFSEISIVDGQQRLVTTFLILQALKELAEENGEKQLSLKINEQYLINKYTEEDTQKLKLKPLVSDDDVYNKIIKGDYAEINKEEKKSNVYINYKYIKDFLKRKYGQHQLETMLKSLDGFYFVAIPLSEDDNAQEIFESINSAGAALSKSDLIRNFILMNVDSQTQDYLYTNYWQKIENLFAGTGKIESFFRMFLANRTYTLSNTDDLYSVFQEWYQKEAQVSSREDILKLILRYARYYYIIFVSDLNKIDLEKEIKPALQEFKKSTIEPTAPFLMEVHNLYETKDINGNRLINSTQYKKIIDLFNTYNIRRNICNLRTGVLTRIIPPMLREVILEVNQDYNRLYDVLVKNLIDKNKGKASFMPDDEYLKANLNGINAYSLKLYLKIILEKIESYNNPAVIDFSNLSIEHLMPQTPSEEWYKMLNVSKEVYEYNLNRLGNLTLATHNDNSKMSNNSFDFKKNVLSNTSHLKINQSILEKDKWDIEEIDNRTKEIINKIIELYPYVTSGMQDISKYRIYCKNENINISAYIYDDLTVDVEANSTFKANYMIDIEHLLTDEVLVDNGNEYKFVEDTRFESLKDITNIIFNDESINEWEEWVDAKGDPLSLELRSFLENKKTKE